MTIDAIQFIEAGTSITELAGQKAVPVPGNFANFINTEIANLNEQLGNADMQIQKLASGEQDNLHQVMLSLEKAKLSFELALQVRNKLLEGYQEIMRMQV